MGRCCCCKLVPTGATAVCRRGGGCHLAGVVVRGRGAGGGTGRGAAAMPVPCRACAWQPARVASPQQTATAAGCVPAKTLPYAGSSRCDPVRVKFKTQSDRIWSTVLNRSLAGAAAQTRLQSASRHGREPQGAAERVAADLPAADLGGTAAAKPDLPRRVAWQAAVQCREARCRLTPPSSTMLRAACMHGQALKCALIASCCRLESTSCCSHVPTSAPSGLHAGGHAGGTVRTRQSLASPRAQDRRQRG